MKDRFDFDEMMNRILTMNVVEILAYLQQEIGFSKTHLNGEKYDKYVVSRYHSNCKGLIFFINNDTEPIGMGGEDFLQYGKQLAEYLVQTQDYPESYLSHFIK